MEAIAMRPDAPQSDAMFKSVGEALSIAFSVTETDPPVKGSTASALESLKEERYGLPPVLDTERAVNRVGLKDIEFRAQCTLIVRLVETRLRDHEHSVVIARFSRRAVRKAVAVRILRDHYRSLCTTQNPDALLALIWAIYVPREMQFPNETPQAFNARRKRREKEWSVRSIEKDYGGSKSTLHRDQITLRQVLAGIEQQAQDRLEGMFVAAGIVRTGE
jgi:hypothetical protein